MQRRPPEDHPAGVDLLGRQGKVAGKRSLHLAVQLQVQLDGGHVRRGLRRPAAELRHPVRKTRAG